MQLICHQCAKGSPLIREEALLLEEELMMNLIMLTHQQEIELLYPLNLSEKEMSDLHHLIQFFTPSQD
jgi:hypothetical protein